MIKAVLFDGKTIIIEPKTEIKNDSVTVSISKTLNTKEIKYIDFDYTESLARKGEDGYILIPNGEGMLCEFKEREDTEQIINRYSMAVFGAKTEKNCFIAIVTGMAYNYELVFGVKNGIYYLYPRFIIEGEDMYEDISVTYNYLKGENADYSGMARCYRKYLLDIGECTPLAERIKNSPELKYAADSVMIRIRNGWKPCPPPIKEQTIENEPIMHTACDFERVGEIIDELKRQGIDKAEICLVGFNTKGHDGRWPQCFPIEEQLGGETALRRLIKKAQNMGYQIVCHSNSTDTYTVSEMWNKDDPILDRNGNFPKEDCWSGGQMYQICPKVALEHAKETLPKIADLGFRGIHYIDVLSIVMPRDCHNKKHPITVGDSIRINREIMSIAKESFGGYSSEGGFDFGAKYLDFALNTDYYGEGNNNDMCDAKVPFWQLTFHGIILSNPNMYKTLNFSCRKEKENAKLKLIEYGGRPTFYYYSVFTGDWKEKQDEDLICDNEEQLIKSVSQIKQGAEINKLMSSLQTSFMEKHEKLSEGIYKINYSNGTVITVNYNNETYEIKKIG